MFQNRGCSDRVAELETEIEVLEAAKAEVEAADGPYHDIETLASRATRDGLVATTERTDDSFTLNSRETGGSQR